MTEDNDISDQEFAEMIRKAHARINAMQARKERAEAIREVSRLGRIVSDLIRERDEARRMVEYVIGAWVPPIPGAPVLADLTWEINE